MVAIPRVGFLEYMEPSGNYFKINQKLSFRKKRSFWINWSMRYLIKWAVNPLVTLFWSQMVKDGSDLSISITKIKQKMPSKKNWFPQNYIFRIFWPKSQFLKLGLRTATIWYDSGPTNGQNKRMAKFEVNGQFLNLAIHRFGFFHFGEWPRFIKLSKWN